MTFIKFFILVFLLINCAEEGNVSPEKTKEKRQSEDIHTQGHWIRHDGVIFGAKGTKTGYYKASNGDIYDQNEIFSGFIVVNGFIENHLGHKTGFTVLDSGALSGCADLSEYPLLRKVFAIWSPLADVKCKKSN
ncbi:MAG: hypothetical protein AB8C84_10785 [Oligoflexales bacterium]